MKFDEKADIAIHSRSTQPAMFLKLTQVFHEQWKIYRGYICKTATIKAINFTKQYNWSFTGIPSNMSFFQFPRVIQFGCYQYIFDFRMFIEIILSLKNCCQLTRHGLCLRNKIPVDSAVVLIDSMQDTQCVTIW